MDYTFRISLRGCEGGNGTGWILDYVLPDETKGEKYPTKFFVASNAHVVNLLNWDKSNPYNQVLSSGVNEMGVGSYRECWTKGGGATIMKEKVNHQDSDFDRKTWMRDAYAMQRTTYDLDQYIRDSNNPQYSGWEQYDWRYHLKNPRLVYLPWNWVGNDPGKFGGRTFNTDYYLADFAVFELNFENENIARWFTKNFYEKYDPVKGYKKDQALNFFAQPLAKKYTNQQLLDKDIRFWAAGYPGKGLNTKAVTNYLNDKNKVGSLTYYLPGQIKDVDGQYLMGHTDQSEYFSQCVDGGTFDCPDWTWNNKSVRFRGYGYAYGDNILSAGASGSLVVSGTKESGKEVARDVVGLFHMYFDVAKVGIVTALRNMEIKDGDGRVISPAYDLIEGVVGQNGSYRDQIQKYVLSQGKETALSKLRGWKKAR